MTLDDWFAVIMIVALVGFYLLMGFLIWKLFK